MRAFVDLPIKHKLTLISLLTSVGALVLACAGFVGYEQLRYKKELIADISATAEMVGYNSTAALSFNDPTAAEQTLQGLVVKPQIVAGFVYEKDGKLFATYPHGKEPGLAAPPPPAETVRFSGNLLEYSRPIVSSGETIGTIFLRVDDRLMRERLNRYGLIGAVVLAVATLAAYLIATRLQRVISNPVSELATIVGHVAADQDYTVRAARRGGDELGRLIDGFNGMLDQIQARDAALQAARNNLEERVVERTTQLQRENSERKRAEEALQASEAFLQSLVENLPVYIFRKDDSGRFTFGNKLFCDRYKCTLAELLGKTAADLLPAAEAERQEEIERQILADGKIRETIEERTDAEGHTTFLQMIKVPVFDRNGVCAGVQGMFLDITERRRAEARLAEASGLLEAMLENSPDFIFFKDRASRFVRFSNAFLRRFGLEQPSQLMGKTDMDFYSSRHAQAALADEQAIIHTGHPVVDKLEKETHVDGRVTWVLTTKMPWRDGKGDIVGTFGISKDVTELKEAEDKLAYERDQLRALLDSSPDTIYFKDLQSRFVLVSRSKVRTALERVPGLRARRVSRGLPGEVLESELLDGLTDFDTFNEADARRAFDDEQRIIATAEAIIGKLEKQVYLDGALRWSLTSKMPWRDREGKIIGTFGISKDITDLKETEEKLQQVHRQLMEASRQAGMAEVATGVLHNVGNVLNSVNVSATLVADLVRHSKAANVAKLAVLFDQNRGNIGDFMTKDPRGQMIPDYLGNLAESLDAEHGKVGAELDNLRKNIEHIKEIVAMQQAYARTSGVIETVSLPEMVEDALRMNAGSLARHDVSLQRDYAARGVVTTDKHKVIQILINLIRNAKYACDETGRTNKQIIVRTANTRQGVAISVVDNGVGIPPENLLRVFNHGFTTRKHGHGFGLHSGALAAKELGGSLEVFSEGAGRGATFILKLPYKRDEPDARPS